MPGIPYVTIISNAGGILQGDRYALRFEAGPGASGHVTTQAATKIHEMDVEPRVADPGDRPRRRTPTSNTCPTPPSPSATPGSSPRRGSPSTRPRRSSIPRSSWAAGSITGRASSSSSTCSPDRPAERPDGSELFTERFVIEPRRGRRPAHGSDGRVRRLRQRPAAHSPHADRILAQVDTFRPGPARRRREPASPRRRARVQGVGDGGRRSAAVREFWSLVRPEVAGFPVPKEFPWK